MPLTGTLARSAAESPVWLCHGPDAPSAARDGWAALGARLLPCRLDGGRVDPGSVLGALGDAGLTRVFCEGGGQLAASLLAADLVDEIHVFSAGLALGAEGHPALGALGVERLDDAPRFTLVGVSDDGGDVAHVWRRAGV